MHERITKIIEFLINAISTGAETPDPNFEHLSEMLLEKGFTEKEIHKAVEWVILNLNPEDVPIRQQPDVRFSPALRTLIAEEISFFSKEAYGHLIQMQLLGILNPIQVEQVIERAFMLGISRIDLEEIRAIVTQVLLGQGQDPAFLPSLLLAPGNDRVN